MKKYALIFAFVLIGLSARAQYLITTTAGNGTAGYSGDNGLATSAQLLFPISVCADAQGNMYIPDGLRIRKVDASSGIITTFAGNGINANNGDGGLATAAALTSTLGIYYDGIGNVYVTCISKVRKINTVTGIISTVAGSETGGYSGDGGPATDAELGFPVGIAVDHSGNIYIADQHNYAVRKVTYSTGIITTIAGTGFSGFSGDGGPASSAQIGFISAIAVDRSGNVYIGDNASIRKINAATGIINTIAGSGMAGYWGDGGPAIAASMYTPQGMCIDTFGNIYISDQIYSVVRKITVATGIINTIAGTGTLGYSGDGSTGTSAMLNLPYGMAVNAAGTIVYIGDKGNRVIRKLSNPLAVSDINTPPSFHIFPNPSSGIISVETGYRQAYSLTVCNTLGQQLYSTSFNNDNTDIDLAALPAGIYMLCLQSQAGTQVQKLVLSR